MSTLRFAGCLALLVAALTGWTHAPVRKEMLRLEVRSASGSPVRVRLQSRGLIVIPEHPTSGRLPTTTDTTLVTPIRLTLGGVGEADLAVATSGATLVVEATQLRQNAPPAERLTGAGFRVTRATYAEPYHVMPMEAPAPARD